MQCCSNNQLPRIEHVEGSSFDRTFTLLDRNGDSYVFPLGSTATFILRSRLDTLLGAFVADILPTPGQVRFRLPAAQTVGKVGRFLWSGTINDGTQIIALEANEFHIVEGVVGNIAVDIPSTPDPIPSTDSEVLNFAQYPVFSLSEMPTEPSNTQLFLNGIKQRFAIDYVISGTTLSWVGSPINFVPNTLEFYY